MNKIIAASVAGVVAVILFISTLEAQLPRGDLYGARALQSLEQALSPLGTLRYPNYAADPFACAAGTEGSYYANTTTNLGMYCDGTNWVAFMAGPAAGITDDFIPVWNAAGPAYEDSLLSDDGTNVTLASGQLSLPDGTAALPSLTWTSDGNTGLYRFGADIIGFSFNGNIRWAMTADAFNGTTAGGATFRRLAGTAALPTYAFVDSENAGIYVVGVNNVGVSVGGALVMDWEDTNAAGAGADLVTIGSLLGIMDGAPDFVRGLTVALTNVNHTGGNVYGISVPALAGTGPDIDATEAAAHLDASWDYALFVDGTTQDIDHGLTTTAMFSPTLAANDNANDQRNIITIDIDIPNGSAGLINALNIDAVTDDVDTIDSAIFVEGGWDSALTLTNRGAVATTNALTGTVLMFLDDQKDYAGDGGNDCAVVFRDGAGGETAFLVVVNGGVCP